MSWRLNLRFFLCSSYRLLNKRSNGAKNGLTICDLQFQLLVEFGKLTRAT